MALEGNLCRCTGLPEHRRRGPRGGRQHGEGLTWPPSRSARPPAASASRVLRKEDAEFITGQGRFVDDIKLPGMLHAAFVRSPVRRTRRSRHRHVGGAEACRASSRVHDRTTTLGLEGGVPCASNPGGNVRQPKRPVLADGPRAHVGEPVAIVLADRPLHGARRAPTRSSSTTTRCRRSCRRRGGRSSRARRSVHEEYAGQPLRDARARRPTASTQALASAPRRRDADESRTSA